VNPEFLDLLPSGEIISVIPAFLELAKAGKLGAIVLDEGVWLDLGDRKAYLQAHRELGLCPAVHPAAHIGKGAILENSVVGPGAEIASGALIRDSVLWPGARISGDAVLDRCIVFSSFAASGAHVGEDI
jgi:NDP-sugar pyrophosphorylase family protein